jgi:type IV fimbrial biogenesis protein FimT
MAQEPRSDGFTLIEVMITVAIAGVLALVIGVNMRGSLGELRAKGAVRQVADLLMLARTEAIRTGDNHIVFVFRDAQDNPITVPAGGPAAAILVRDANGNGTVEAGEKVAGLPVDATGSLRWGSAFAEAAGTPAPNGNPAATFLPADPDFACCTFTTPGALESRWVLFLPDGTPRAFSIGPFATGNIGSGNGAVYVTSDTRDYAVVLAPLGGVRVHIWERGANAWTN